MTADAEGTLSFTGFKGDYTLRTDAGQADLALDGDVAGTLQLSE